MKAIIAVNNLGFIGKYDSLPWNCPDDLKHFKKLTMGWCSKYEGVKILDNITCDLKEMHIVYGNPENWIRPKSLFGLDDNNGWIKIESEEDLPKEDCDCYIYSEFNIISKAMYSNKYFKEFNDIYHFSEITHYKIKENIKPPLY